MLAQRIATALALAAAVLIVLFLLPAAATIGVLTLLVLTGAWEWAAFAGLNRPQSRLAYTAGVGAAMLAVWWLVVAGRVLPLPALLWASLGWWALALVWVVFRPVRVTPALAGLSGLVVLVPAWLALATLYLNGGPRQLLLVLLVIWAADIGAYVIGRGLGRVKLAPRVSPRKTWEGVIGGLMAAAAVGFAGAHRFELPVAPFLALCLGAALLSVVGDLTESMFKRNVGVKDSGGALPGHGGVLDRIDSVTAAAPLFALGLDWIA